MGRTDLIDDPDYLTDYVRLDRADDVIEVVEHWLCGFDDIETPLVLLAAERISSGPVLAQREMPEHPYFVARGSFGEVEYPGVGPVRVLRPPFRFSDATAGAGRGRQGGRRPARGPLRGGRRRPLRARRPRRIRRGQVPPARRPLIPRANRVTGDAVFNRILNYRSAGATGRGRGEP
jgi:hypothetical protein